MPGFHLSGELTGPYWVAAARPGAIAGSQGDRRWRVRWHQHRLAGLADISRHGMTKKLIPLRVTIQAIATLFRQERSVPRVGGGSRRAPEPTKNLFLSLC